MSELRKEIEAAINRCNGERGSNTPDYILADYFMGCLSSFDAATVARDKWQRAGAESITWTRPTEQEAQPQQPAVSKGPGIEAHPPTQRLARPRLTPDEIFMADRMITALREGIQGGLFSMRETMNRGVALATEALPRALDEIDALKAELAEARAQLANFFLPIPDASVRSIVAAYLRQHGYDGLYDASDCDVPCVCTLDAGLMADCCGYTPHCAPGYLGPCTCGEGHEFDIHPTKVAIPGWRGEVDDDGDK